MIKSIFSQLVRGAMNLTERPANTIETNTSKNLKLLYQILFPKAIKARI